MNDFWNKRYGAAAYAYGEESNAFIKEELSHRKPGKILFPAEGEGRNAVYAATLGWDVAAFDPSIEGKKKAGLLAKKHNAEIDYQVAGYANAEYQPGSFDCLVLVFAHMPPEIRNATHKKLVNYLKPGGTLLLEGFSKKQIHKNSGGPQNIDFLFSKEELESDFSDFPQLHISETETTLDEGPYHQGDASVIRVVGKK